MKTPKSKTPNTIVHIASGDLWAGAEVQLYNLAKELNKNKQFCLLIVLLNHGILEDMLLKIGINVTVFDEKKLNSLRIFLRICSFLKRYSPDIVHTHRQKENVIGSFAAFLCSTARSLRTVHGSPELKPGFIQIHKRLFDFIDWLSGRILQHRIVAVSAHLAQKLTKRFPERIIRVIENGIDVDELQRTAAEIVDLPGPSDAINIAIVGRLVPVKRTDIFLHVAQLLTARTETRYAFYIFGDGPLRDSISMLSKALGLNHQVFIMGFRPNIAAYLSKMNILLITSDHEGLPMNLLEALGLRIPVIAHAVGGIPVVLDNGRCGVLVTENTPETYVEAITNCLADTGRLAHLVENGYQQLMYRYTVKNTAALYGRLYQEMLS